MTTDSMPPAYHETLEDRLLRKLPFGAQIDRLDARVTAWMARYGLTMMRVALGIIFFWFGALKLVPGMTSAHCSGGKTCRSEGYAMPTATAIMRARPISLSTTSQAGLRRVT